jgi:hypothetical protein
MLCLAENGTDMVQFKAIITSRILIAYLDGFIVSNRTSGGCMCKLWGHLAPQVLKKLVEIYCSIYDMTPQLLLAGPTGFDCWIRH